MMINGLSYFFPGYQDWPAGSGNYPSQKIKLVLIASVGSQGSQQPARIALT